MENSKQDSSSLDENFTTENKLVVEFQNIKNEFLTLSYNPQLPQKIIIKNIKKKNQNETILLQQELMGASTKKLNKKYCLVIFLYKDKKEVQKQNKIRQKKIVEIKLYHEQQNMVLYWKNLLQNYSYDENFFKNNMNQIKNGTFNQAFQKKVLILINPTSGPGNSQKNWENFKQVILNAGYLTQIIVSAKRNHIQEYIQTIKKEQLQQFTGIIIFSGDGLPHEVINGLMNRVDRKELVDIGICPVPSGSGNAFAQELNTRANLQNTIVSSLFNFIKGKKQKMDLIQLLLDQNKNVYSFLSLNFSYVADIDINSEFLRCLGGSRFDIYGTFRALIQKGENAKLSLKESYNTDNNNNQKASEIQQQKFKQENIFQGKFKYLQFNNISYLSESCRSAPFSQINDGKIDVQFLLNCSYCNFLNMALKFSSGKQFDQKTQQTVVDQLQHQFVEEFELECENKNTLISVDGEKFLVKSVKGKIMPLAISVFCIQ